MATKEKATTQFRRLLDQPEIVVAPGAYDCLTAKIIEQAGFPAVYMTGAGTSVARLGQPDLALATMTEMLANAAAIADAVKVPVIADADTGYGGVLNVGRTVRQYERTGVAAILDLEEARRVIREAAESENLVLPVPEVEALVTEFGDNAINIDCRFWHDPTILGENRATDEVARAVYTALGEHGIVIAFPQRTLWWGRGQQPDPE